MEDLSQTQLILLCLLTSFVTSIGTGIITVSLLQEAPQTVTQTINRVVERTVETIVPELPASPRTVTREVTVVVKEEDLVIDAINKSRNSLVSIVENLPRGGTVVRSVGVVVKSDGTILADKRYVTNNNDYSAVFFAGGEVVPLKISATSKTTNAIFLTPDARTSSTGTTTNPESKKYTAATLNNLDNAQLGQTVIALGGRDKEAVAIGRISLINHIGDQGEATSTKAVASIETDAPVTDGLPGSILFNLNGEIVGFENYDSRTGLESLYTAINIIRRENSAFFE